MFNKFLDPKNDVAFKRIFGSEKHKDILIHFLNDVLTFKGPHAIQTVEFLSPIQDPDIAVKKQSIVDVLCKDGEGVQYIIEMQVAKYDGFEERAQYYAAKAYSRQSDVGGRYKDLKEIIFIAIANYIIFPEKEAYKSDHVTLDKKTYEHDLKAFSFTFIELPKFNKTNINELETVLEKWCYFFRYAPSTPVAIVDTVAGEDEVIKEAYQALNSFYWSDEEMQRYDQESKRERDYREVVLSARDEGRQEGLQEGRQEGLEEGLKKGAAEGERLLLKRQLQRKFGTLPQNYLNQLEQANADKLLAWSERILEAKSLADVFD